MAKTVTLRLDDEVYDLFVAAAKAENRPLSNLIETAALSRIREQRFVSASGSWTTSSSIRGVIIVFWKKARYSWVRVLYCRCHFRALKSGNLMKKLLIAWMLFLAGCVGIPGNVKPVENFRLERYLGKRFIFEEGEHFPFCSPEFLTAFVAARR